MLKILLCLLVISFSSCSVNKPSEYQIASQKSTPVSFAVGSRWSFVLLGSNDQIIKSVIFEITDIDVKTCVGETKQLKVISEEPIGTYPKLIDPTYSVNGAALRINFSGGWCDSNYALIGTLSDLGASGHHMSEVMNFDLKSKRVSNKFFGIPILK